VGALAGTALYDSAATNGDSHFSADVLAVDLVLADGTIRTVALDTERELIRFVRTAQGLLGVVVRATLRLYPACIHLVSWARAPSLHAVLEPPTLGHARYCYIHPCSGAVITETHERVAPCSAPRSRAPWMDALCGILFPVDTRPRAERAAEAAPLPPSSAVPLLTMALARWLDHFCNAHVRMRFVPSVQWALQWLLVLSTRLLGPGRLSIYDRSVLGPARRPISLADWQFTRAQIEKVLPKLITLCRSWRDKQGVCPAFISLYYVPASSEAPGYPNPASGPLFSVDVVSYHPHAVATLELAWAQLAREHGGLPSLNKNADANLTAADVRALYGDAEYEQFRQLCADFDPSGRFTNGVLSALFSLQTPTC